MMVWKHMLSRGCSPEVVAYSSIIKGLCSRLLLLRADPAHLICRVLKDV